MAGYFREEVTFKNGASYTCTTGRSTWSATGRLEEQRVDNSRRRLLMFSDDAGRRSARKTEHDL
jgi:hypothetical protein